MSSTSRRTNFLVSAWTQTVPQENCEFGRVFFRTATVCFGDLMVTLSGLFFENGLPNLPAVLIEPHRNRGGVWRIKFSFETGEPLSMSVDQASTMASGLHKIGEAELADEIDDAIKSAVRYASM